MIPVLPNRVWRMVKLAAISTMAASISGLASSVISQTRCCSAAKPAARSCAMKRGSS